MRQMFGKCSFLPPPWKHGSPTSRTPVIWCIQILWWRIQKRSVTNWNIKLRVPRDVGIPSPIYLHPPRLTHTCPRQGIECEYKKKPHGVTHPIQHEKIFHPVSPTAKAIGVPNYYNQEGKQNRTREWSTQQPWSLVTLAHFWKTEAVQEMVPSTLFTRWFNPTA